MADTLLDVQNVTHDFSLSKTACVRALDRLSFSIRRGEIYGLVGESGSGKSTAARCVMNLVQPRAGQIFYQGIDITNPRQFAANKKLLQTSRQMIFQDSTSSLNGRMKVCDIIAEPMRIARMTPKRGTYRKEAAFQMKYVGLDEMYLDKYPGADFRHAAAGPHPRAQPQAYNVRPRDASDRRRASRGCARPFCSHGGRQRNMKHRAGKLCRTLAVFLLSMLVLSLLVFVIARLAPGDPLVSY